MSDREKLIKLMFEALKYVEDACEWSTCEGCYLTSEIRDCRTIMAADHLISNGVTVQNWIPVSERLPKFGQPVLVSCAGYELDYVTAHTFWSEKRYDWVSVTHWMPLPEPPKECE